MPNPIKVPQSAAELINDPRVAAAFNALNALLRMEGRLVGPSGSATLAAGRPVLIGEPPNLILQIPLAFPNAWAAPSGTQKRSSLSANDSTTASNTYQKTELQAVNDRLKETRQILAALIADLRATTMAPNQ